MADSVCCTAENKTTLWSSYTPIKILIIKPVSMPKGTQQVHITLTITAETRETPTWAAMPSVKRVKCRVLWRLGLGMKKWAMRFPSVALKSVNFCGLVWKERGSVVRSRTGSGGTHWSRTKASQPSCLTKASSSWGGRVRLGKVKLLCRVKSWSTRGGRGGPSSWWQVGIWEEAGSHSIAI